MFIIASNPGFHPPSLLKHSVRVARVHSCEGCEWAAFWNMARADPEALSQVRVILIELHVSKTLKMLKKEDFRMFEEFFRFVFVRHGFRVAYLRGNVGGWRDRAIATAMREAGATPGQCCYELMLVKPGLEERER